MDSGSSTAVAAGGGGDKLSRLGDAALGHILSFLPATEAARTAALSQRWRHVFAAVHTLSFGESEGPLSMGYQWWRLCDYCDSDEVLPPRFVAGVSSALNGRHRGARAATAALRALRVAFDEFGFRGGDDTAKAVDAWLWYAVHAAGDAMDIDLRLGTEPICERKYALASATDDDSAAAKRTSCRRHHRRWPAAESDGDDESYGPVGKDKYVVPRSLFSSCAALRALRLGRCLIALPSAIALPFLDTLHLTRVTGRKNGGGGAIQRLVSACPSLVDLTLEACGDLTELSLHGARLRRLALRCCHGLATVDVGTPELRAFEYRGAIPPASLLATHHAHAAAPRKISFCALDLCGVHRRVDLLCLTELLAGVERLHLTSARLGRSFVGRGGAFPCLPTLRNLEITGMLPDDNESAVTAVARILERTPRLETLSLFFLPEPHPVKEDHHVNREVLDAFHTLRYDPQACLSAPRDVVEIPCCLRKTIKAINLVHYQGSVAQRALAKLLLCNAPDVEEVCWKVARGPLSIQTKLMEEVRGWVVNKSANMMFF